MPIELDCHSASLPSLRTRARIKGSSVGSRRIRCSAVGSASSEEAQLNYTASPSATVDTVGTATFYESTRCGADGNALEPWMEQWVKDLCNDPSLQ